MKFKINIFSKIMVNEKTSQQILKLVDNAIKEDRKAIAHVLSQTGIPSNIPLSGSEDSVEAILKFFDEEVYPVSDNTKVSRKKGSPKKSKDGERMWIDPAEALAIAKKNLEELLEKEKESDDNYGQVETICLHIPNKGANKNKTCGKIITMKSDNKNIYGIKCNTCVKCNTEKKILALEEFYQRLGQNVDEVKCSPTGNFNVPDLAGVREGAITPEKKESTPQDFINGNTEGLPSPSDAKSGRKKSPKIPKMKSGKQDKANNFHDCIIIEPIKSSSGEDYTWFVRKTLSPVSYKVSGKFKGSIKSLPEDYLEELVELEEEEIERVQNEMNINYKFLGQGKTEEVVEEVVEVEEDEEDEIDDPMDDLLNELDLEN